MASALIVFSNPTDTSRIRLDKEHRAVDRGLERAGVSSAEVERRHAASRSDVATVLASGGFEIVQFSGHGSDEGVFVESDRQDASEVLTPADLLELLLQFQPRLQLLVLMSCYSATAARVLVEGAAYVITADGPANDEAAVRFTESFYEVYFKTRSIEKAFGVASFVTEQSLSIVLTRRATEGSKVKELVAVYSKKRPEPMYMDLSAAESSIESLGVPRDYIVSTLGRKLHIHRWIFEEPRDRAVLTVGGFFGIFSWTSPNDIIVCHKILKLKGGVPETMITLWSELIVAYNDLYMSEYRLLPRAVDSSTASTVEKAISAFNKANQYFFERIGPADWLSGEARSNFAAIRSTFAANINKAAEKLSSREYARAVVFLETALSSVHDFIDSLVVLLTEG